MHQALSWEYKILLVDSINPFIVHIISKVLHNTNFFFYLVRLFNFYLAVFAFVNWPYLLLSMTDVQWLLWLFLDLIFTLYTQRARGTPLHPGGKDDKWTGVCPGNFDATKEQYNKWWAWTQQGAEAAAAAMATAKAKETAQKVMTHLQHLIWGQRQLLERVQWVITINQAAGWKGGVTRCTLCPVRRAPHVGR